MPEDPLSNRGLPFSRCMARSVLSTNVLSTRLGRGRVGSGCGLVRPACTHTGGPASTPALGPGAGLARRPCFPASPLGHPFRGKQVTGASGRCSGVQEAPPGPGPPRGHKVPCPRGPGGRGPAPAAPRASLIRASARRGRRHSRPTESPPPGQDGCLSKYFILGDPSKKDPPHYTDAQQHPQPFFLVFSVFFFSFLNQLKQSDA